MSGPPAIVHVAPFGPETRRITHPAVEWRADHVVLVDYLPPGPYDDIRNEVLETLEAEGIEYSVPDYDVESDLFEAVAAMSTEIERQTNELVYVNLASGSKVMAIGGMIAAMTSESATPYYVTAEDAGSVVPSPATNVTGIEELPRYPMERPEYQHIAVMKFIHESSRYHEQGDGRPYQDKSTLIEFGIDAELAFMRGNETANSKAQFGHLNSKICDPLEERGYAEDVQVGRHHRILLTNLGRNTLRSFEHLLSEDTLSAIGESRHTELA